MTQQAKNNASGWTLAAWVGSMCLGLMSTGMVTAQEPPKGEVTKYAGRHACRRSRASMRPADGLLGGTD